MALHEYHGLYKEGQRIKGILQGGKLVWPVQSEQPVPPPGPDYTEPFYVENITNVDETLTIKKISSSTPVLTIEYSLDRMDWRNFGSTSSVLKMTLSPGQKIYLRCNATCWSTGSGYFNCIVGVSKIGGNVMSLLYGNKFNGTEKRFPTTEVYTLSNVFGGLPSEKNNILLSANELLLPATTLNSYCYAYMFRYCTALTSAPELPATVLKSWCYSGMFEECALTEAPLLPVKYLVERCYYRMFLNCSHLNKITCLATTNINKNNSTYQWTEGVSTIGTFYKAASVTWPSGRHGIPTYWTKIDV